MKKLILIILIMGVLKIFTEYTYVYWSWSRDECVKIIHNEVVLPCSDLPMFDQYEIIYVE